MTAPELMVLTQKHEAQERELASALRSQLPAIYGLVLDAIEGHRSRLRADLWRRLEAAMVPPKPAEQPKTPEQPKTDAEPAKPPAA